MAEYEHPTDWSDRLANIAYIAMQAATVYLLAEHMGFSVTSKLMELWERIKQRFRQWQFEAFYTAVWPALRQQHGISE